MITDAGIKMLGFLPMAAGDSITAAFHLIRIYGIRGIVLDTSDRSPYLSSGPGYQLGVGSTLNAIGKGLVGEGFVEDEAKWCEENSASPPFLVLHVGPTDAVTVTKGYSQRKDGALWTYDCFREAKAELERREEAAIEPALAALSVAFSDRSHTVGWHFHGRQLFGRTDRGEMLYDIALRASGSLSVASPISSNELADRLQHAVTVQRELSGEIGRFYYLGLNESDALKQFLYFFLFIERYTHQTFATVRRTLGSGVVVNVPARLAASGSSFAKDLQENAKTLLSRFMWCALLAWSDLSDDDVSTFRHVKRERDRLSHGERTTVDEALAKRARELGAKLIRCAVPGIAGTRDM